MTPLTCAAARRRLHAFYDGELPVGDQIAVQAHVDWCEPCADRLVEVQSVGAVLRAGSPGREVLSQDEASAFTAAVLGRSAAEHDASFVARVQHMFDDLHLVYAGVGATVATAACLIVMSGMMGFASTGHPDASPSASLAATLTLLATPGTSANAIVNDAASHARGSARFQAASESAQEDAVFWIESVVTRDGRLIRHPPARRQGVEERVWKVQHANIRSVLIHSNQVEYGDSDVVQHDWRRRESEGCP